MIFKNILSFTLILRNIIYKMPKGAKAWHRSASTRSEYQNVELFDWSKYFPVVKHTLIGYSVI